MFSRIVLTTLVAVFVAVSLSLTGGGLAFADDDLFGGFAEIPEKVVSFMPLLSTSSLEAGSTYDAAVLVTMAPGWHINSDRPYQGWLIPADLKIESIEGIRAHSIVFPMAGTDLMMDERMSVFGDSTLVRFKIDIDSSLADGEYTLPIRFSYQPCDDKSCLAPETEELVLDVTVGAKGHAIHTELFGSGATVEDVPDEPIPADDEAESDLQRLIDKHGFWGYLAALGIAFVTGLLLSFSPCTYPMIPITVSVFAGRERSLWQGFVLSLFYVGSMAVMYGIMGLIVSLVGGVFGAWLSSPPVVIGIAVVFVVFSLSMFGLYNLQMPAALQSKLGSAGRGGGVVGSIVLGIVAALVVSPCVGPFVAGILLYVATSGSPALGFLVLFVFALGLGTLFLIIGTFSSAVSSLPGAGGWMESVKKFFGFVLLLMAIYFVRTIIPATVTAVLTGLLLLAFAVFGGGLDRLSPESGMFLRLKKFLGILAFLVGTYLLLGTIISSGLILPPASNWLPVSGSAAGGEEHELISWQTDLEAGLARARAEGKPVLIDTWATWCANCRVLDKKTFGNPDVAAEAERFVPIKIHLEKSDSEITKDFKSRFGLKQFSLPTTLLLGSDGTVRKTLRGVVGPEDMIAEMKKIN